MALDIARTTAVASAYLRSGADRKAYQATVALAARRFQNDPHNQKIAISTFEEYAHNGTHLRDRLLPGDGTAARWLGQNARRARLPRVLHERVDLQLTPGPEVATLYFASGVSPLTSPTARPRYFATAVTVSKLGAA